MFRSQAATHLLTGQVIYVLNYLHSNHRHPLSTYCVRVQLDISCCDTLSLPMVALKVLCADAFWFCFFLVVVGVRLRVVGWCENVFLGGRGEGEGILDQ